MPTLIVTGSDSAHFVNSQMLVASWWDTNRETPFAYCDFGLTPDQVAEVQTWPVIYVPSPLPGKHFSHPWRAKAAVLRYVSGLSWTNLVWIDADALLLQSLSRVSRLMQGYDLLIDAHQMSVGEIVLPETQVLLPDLELEDAYFSAGFWVTSSRPLLEEYDRACEVVVFKGNLWEGDAFVAAVYRTRARIRTVCGSIWHVRGKTSHETVDMSDGVLSFAGFPCIVLHANANYTLREDGRRIFKRDILREIQDRWEARFLELRNGDWRGV
jgi:hypothetical protein